MQVIEPLQFTYGMLISSNVAENEYPVWTAPAIRAVGDQVIYNHKIYKALVALTASTDVNPETGTAAPTKWLLVGATNRWRMFDDKVGTLTTNAGTVEVVLKPGQVINGIGLFNLQGSSVTITMEDGATILYTRTVSLIEYGVDNWYDYFYAPVVSLTDIVELDLPSYGNANIRIKVDAGSGTAAVGSVAMGRVSDVGDALYGSSFGITDYSRKETDEFGNASIVERDFSKFGDYDVELDTRQASSVQKLAARVRATPCVWVGYADYELTIVYGYFKEFTMTIEGPEISTYNLRIEGLI